METNQNLPGQRVMPTLRITDYARSKAFYVDGLGFQIDWEHRFKLNHYRLKPVGFLNS